MKASNFVTCMQAKNYTPLLWSSLHKPNEMVDLGLAIKRDYEQWVEISLGKGIDNSTQQTNDVLVVFQQVASFLC